jgi:hypothetical protein
MPRTRQTALQIQDASIRKAISGSAAFYGLSMEQQYETVGVKRATWYRRLNDPGTFTLREIRRMALRYRWDAKTVCDFIGVKEVGPWRT